MKLTFWGAAQQVTGSMYLLELDDGYKILIDCGMDMEKDRGKDLTDELIIGERPSNSVFPFDPSDLDVVLLTHAHLDHSGLLPNLYREGFEGQILCTAPTAELTYLLLQDSAMLNQRKLNKLNKRFSQKKNVKVPNYVKEWYVSRHVEEAYEQFVPISFNSRFRLRKGVDVTFVPAGHLLGASHILLQIDDNGTKKSIGFSGDIGRYNYPLLVDPQPLPAVDYLLCETTYGSRLHSSVQEAEDEFARIIEETCVKIAGRLIIPAFSVGRTQALLYTFHKLSVAGKLPPIKIFSDSPLALQSTKIYEKYNRYLNKTAQEFKNDNDWLFDFDNLVYVENLKDSKQLSNYNQPCIIISSSGMMEGGRIQHHVAKNLNNPYCTILMVGYSAEGTLGHELLMGKKELRIGDNLVPVLAKVVYTDVLSGHGDQKDLLKFVKHQAPEHLKQLFLIHGEPQSMEDFKNLVQEHGYTKVTIPHKGQEVVL
jgi:metallo-beta-lactamase family protein